MMSRGRGWGVGSGVWGVAIVAGLALGSAGMAKAAVQAGDAPAGGPTVEAEFYQPPAATAYDDVEQATGKPKIIPLTPSLVLRGHDVPATLTSVAWRFDQPACQGGVAPIEVRDGRFETAVTTAPCSGARAVQWELRAGSTSAKGVAPLSFARFSGHIVYRDGKQRPAYIVLLGVAFGAPGQYVVPVADNGTFDARVPARVYSIINVNSAYYAREAMERWAWEFDLTKDREEVFTIGRTELYSMHAWELNGGQPLVFITFRPSALSRVANFDRNRDGQLDQPERALMMEQMKKSPTVIGPELEAANIKAWLDGVPHPIARVDRIPEASAAGIWQIEYLVQLTPATKPARGRRHEVRLEVESKETMFGQPMTDFGQGSVGYLKQ